VFYVGEKIKVTAVICSNESRSLYLEYPWFVVKIYKDGLYVGTEPSYYVLLDITRTLKLTPGKCYRETLSVPLYLPGHYTLQPFFVFKEATKADKKAVLGEEKVVIVEK